MARIHFVFMTCFTLLLVGCITMPETPEILIKNVKDGGIYTEKDIFVVNKPISQIAAVLKNKSAECLQQKVSLTMQDASPGIKLNRKEVHVYTPKVTVKNYHVRLTLQEKVTEGATQLGNPPPDGMYMMVVDAYPIDKNSTRVESYIQSGGRSAFKAVKLWATGKDMSCPNLNQ